MKEGFGQGDYVFVSIPYRLATNLLGETERFLKIACFNPL